MSPRPHLRPAFFILAAFSLLPWGRPATATSVAAMTDADLVRHSAVIVEGTVIEAASAWDAAHRRIHTTVVLDVSRTLKGPDRDRLTLRTLGGRVGNTVAQVVGAPGFTPGEEVILFVHDETDELPVTGLFQGKLTLAFDSARGERVVVERGIGVERFAGEIARMAREGGER